MQTETPDKKRYILTIIDDHSRYTTVHLMKFKNEATSLIKQFVEFTKTQFNKKPKIIRSDQRREYVNDDLINYLRKEGIRMQYTVAYTPQQNGVAERKNRTLCEMARCMLIDADMYKRYWGEAVMTANYLQNILPTSCWTRTPYELWFCKKPNAENLHVFGSKVFAHIPKKHRRKLDEKLRELTFVGYYGTSKVFRLLDASTNKITISRDVVFIKELKKNSKTINAKEVDKQDLNEDNLIEINKKNASPEKRR